MTPPRVALVHDWLTGMRGGERCLEVLCELFPAAPVFTLLHVPGSVSSTIENRRIVTSFVQRLPDAARRYRQYLPLFPAAVRHLDVRGHDLIISLSHCVAKGVRVPPGCLHLSYCFTPMRYVWDLYDDYFRRDAPLGVRAFMPAVAAALRRWDRRTASVHHFIAISRHIADRIRRIYGRAADVIHPPVDMRRFCIGRAEDFYLVVSALAPYKRVDLAVAAATRLGRRLLVVGTGPDEAKLRRLAGPTVEFLGWRPDDEVAELYARCRAVLFTALEDFGIVPLEAAAAGRPTIAFGRGGVLDTMIPLDPWGPASPPSELDGDGGPTAVFYEAQTVEALAAAVERFEAAEDAGRFTPAWLRARAERFDRARFAEHLRQYVDARWREHPGRAGRAC
jgi:glycosyltransferase involved in cell wall biosynthesis